ncbi:MAG: 30S ribosomal protein S18 [Parcubacteria group bacterium]|nr:30S ribosomal protein S18 [Parcubacteria group bacterium]
MPKPTAQAPAKKTTGPIRDKACYFCLNMYKEVDYKDAQLLRRFMSSYAKIAPRRRSGVCMKHQRKLATAIKYARIMALVPFTRR